MNEFGDCVCCGKPATSRVVVAVCGGHRYPEKTLRVLGRARRQAITSALRLKILGRDQRCCRYCGKVVERFGVGPDDAIIEHVIPRGRSIGNQFGTDDEQNLVLACGACNRRKRSRTPKQAKMELRPAPGAVCELAS